MVKKNYVLLMLGLVFVTVGLFAYVFEDKEPTENSLLLANVEALTQSESEGTGKILHCSKATSFANCYFKSNGEWCCMSILSVEEYEVEEGTPVNCLHDTTSDCPEYTTVGRIH